MFDSVEDSPAALQERAVHREPADLHRRLPVGAHGRPVLIEDPPAWARRAGQALAEITSRPLIRLSATRARRGKAL